MEPAQTAAQWGYIEVPSRDGFRPNLLIWCAERLDRKSLRVSGHQRASGMRSLDHQFVAHRGPEDPDAGSRPHRPHHRGTLIPSRQLRRIDPVGTKGLSSLPEAMS